jgi:arylformamidase
MYIIDITQPLLSSRVYPGDTAPVLTRVRQMPEYAYNLTDLSMCVHNGTHVDAPRHFIDGGAGVGDVCLDVFYGPCTVADWGGSIGPLLEAGAERLLIRGDAQITPEAAAAIVQAGVRLVGVEGQSVGAENAPMEVHQILLGAGVILLEGLVLENVTPGGYTLSAFPLNLGPDCDGSPVRAVLISD